MSVEVEHPALGVIRQAGNPLDFASTPGAIRTPRTPPANAVPPVACAQKIGSPPKRSVTALTARSTFSSDATLRASFRSTLAISRSFTSIRSRNRSS